MSEAFYDEHIAPELMRLAKLCETNGMSFLCQVEYAPEETAETKAVTASAGLKTVIARAGMECHGNVDSFMIGVQRYAMKHGHSSAVLTILGVPTRPTASDASAARRCALCDTPLPSAYPHATCEDCVNAGKLL